MIKAYMRNRSVNLINHSFVLSSEGGCLQLCATLDYFQFSIHILLNASILLSLALLIIIYYFQKCSLSLICSVNFPCWLPVTVSCFTRTRLSYIIVQFIIAIKINERVFFVSNSIFIMRHDKKICHIYFRITQQQNIWIIPPHVLVIILFYVSIFLPLCLCTYIRSFYS